MSRDLRRSLAWRNGSTRCAEHADACDRDSQADLGLARRAPLIQIALLGAGALLILDLQATGGIMIARLDHRRARAGADRIRRGEPGKASSRCGWHGSGSTKSSQRAQARRRHGAAGAQGQVQRGPASASSIPATPQDRSRTMSASSLPPGESLGIIGPSASGKSTLVRLLVGAWPCTLGHGAAGRRRHLCLAARRTQPLCRLSAAGRRTVRRHGAREHRAHERRRSRSGRARRASAPARMK